MSELHCSTGFPPFWAFSLALWLALSCPTSPTWLGILPGQNDSFLITFSALPCPPHYIARIWPLGLFALLLLSLIFRAYPLSSNSSPSWSARCSHSISLSAPPSRPPTSVVIRYFRSGCTAFLFASRLATHLFSGRRCHPIPRALSSFLRTLLSLRHFRHLVYKWCTDCSARWHHQHSAVSVAPILSKRLRLLHVQLLAGKTVPRISLVLVLTRGVFRVLGGKHNDFGSFFPFLHFYSNAMSRFSSFWRSLSSAWHELGSSTVPPGFYY